MRKIISFFVIRSNKDDSGIIYALCDDGTLWWKLESATSEWSQENSIPQDSGTK